jgi:hypothetical protein
VRVVGVLGGCRGGKYYNLLVVFHFLFVEHE